MATGCRFYNITINITITITTCRLCSVFVFGTLVIASFLYLVSFPSQIVEKGKVSSGSSNVTLVGDDDAIKLTNCFFDL